LPEGGRHEECRWGDCVFGREVQRVLRSRGLREFANLAEFDGELERFSHHSPSSVWDQGTMTACSGGSWPCAISPRSSATDAASNVLVVRGSAWKRSSAASSSNARA